MNSIPKRLGALFGGLALILILSTPTAIRADEWTLSTVFSINQTFEVPGKVLEPNTRYMIRLLDSPATRDVVQIFNEDRTQIITTFLSIPEIRREATDETVFEFMEVPAGNPMPIRSWFYPGRTTGREFLYPKAQLERIAAYSAAPVRTAAVSAPEVGRIEVEQRETQAAVGEPAVEENVAIAQNVPPSEPALPQIAAVQEKSELEVERAKPTEPGQEAVTSPATAELPQTADGLALYGLAGLLSLALGLTARASMRR